MSNRTDNFNRANSSSTMGTPSDGGSSWSALSGTWGISSNRGYRVSTGSQEVVILESGLSDCTVAVTLASFPSGSDGLIIVRATDDNNYILIQGEKNTSGCTIYKKDTGAFASLATGAITYADNDIISVVLSGTSISVLQNGTTKLSTTSSFNQSATKHGIRGNGGTAFYFDDFSVTGSGGGGVHPYWAGLMPELTRRGNYYA